MRPHLMGWSICQSTMRQSTRAQRSLLMVHATRRELVDSVTTLTQKRVFFVGLVVGTGMSVASMAVHPNQDIVGVVCNMLLHHLKHLQLRRELRMKQVDFTSTSFCYVSTSHILLVLNRSRRHFRSPIRFEDWPFTLYWSTPCHHLTRQCRSPGALIILLVNIVHFMNSTRATGSRLRRLRIRRLFGSRRWVFAPKETTH